MATIQKFEDLIAWQRARELTQFIYNISKYRKEAIATYRNFDKGLAGQIQRAAVSVMSNIAEGFDRGTRQELINYLYIAKGSCGEVRCQLYVALDAGYIDMSKFRNGLQLTDECSRLLHSFIEKVKVGSKMGMQYKKEYKKGMSDFNRQTLEEHPEWREFYNADGDYIAFWKMHEKGKE